MDVRLERIAVRSLTAFLLLLSVASALSLVLILVGVLQSSANSRLIPHDPVEINNRADFITDHDLTPGVSAWPQFLSECCCSPNGPMGRFPVTELWECASGWKKIKARQETLSDGSLASGLTIRGLCSLNFHAGICKEPFFESSPNGTVPIETMDFFKQDLCDQRAWVANSTDPLPSLHELHRLW